MDISLSPEQKRLVRRKVNNGRYKSAHDVIDEALRLIDARDRLDDIRKGDIKAEIAVGVASLRAGRTVDGEAVFDRLEAALNTEEPRGSRRAIG